MCVCIMRFTLTGKVTFLQVEEQVISIPLVIVCPAHDVQLYKDCLSDNEYFGVINQKVRHHVFWWIIINHCSGYFMQTIIPESVLLFCI